MFRRITARRDDFFKGVNFVVHHLPRTRGSGALAIELPKRYERWSAMLASFPCSSSEVRRLMPSTDLRPVEIAPGLGLVTLLAADYTDLGGPQPRELDGAKPLGPYKELALMFPVRCQPWVTLPLAPLVFPRLFKDVGFHITHIYVTGLDAKRAGAEIWGYPKEQVDPQDIEFIDDGAWRVCKFRTGGDDVLTFRVQHAEGRPEAREFITYPVTNGHIVRVFLRAEGRFDETYMGGASYELHDDSHPVVEVLRQLDAGTEPIQRLYAPCVRSLLYPPTDHIRLGGGLPAPADTRTVEECIEARLTRRPLHVPKRRRVVVLGGGVAGLSAAHELLEREFEVVVYEKGQVPGGKARSLRFRGEGKDGAFDLPAEHGFRFFPGFYRHLPDTMSRILYEDRSGSVVDHLVDADLIGFSIRGRQPFTVPAGFPRSVADLVDFLILSENFESIPGLHPGEIDFYVERIWQLMTSAEERRTEEYDKVSWWDYITGRKPRSEAYQKHLASTTRVLVAADPKVSSTKTVGDILLQLLFNFAEPGAPVDRVLDGPTNDVWIDPWREHLERYGQDRFRYETGARVDGLVCRDGEIRGVRVQGQRDLVTGDYYIAALPVERMARLLNDDVRDGDPSLGAIELLARDVDWMNGIVYYLNDHVPLQQAHYLFLGLPWALTAVSQLEFWRENEHWREYVGDTVQTILSVCISDWNTPGAMVKKRAKECTGREEIADEVWYQLQEGLPELKEIARPRFYLDEDIVFRGDPGFDDGFDDVKQAPVRNREPLLVNKVNRWHVRPDARTAITNLFLASDYVRTFTDLATMEAANEAARRAVNAILDVSGVNASRCRLWKLNEPAILEGFRWIDRCRYERGERWRADFPLVDLFNEGRRLLGGVVRAAS